MSDLAPNLHIVHFPHPVLRQKCKPISEITDDVRAIANRMFDLMADAEGLGLAAPQVAVPWRMFITAPQEGAPARVYINPVLSPPHGGTGSPITSVVAGDSRPGIETREEGCLSLPDVHVDVRRPVDMSITATDLDGNEFTLRSDQLIARVWQHEADHLDGILIIDKMNPMDRLANRKAIKALHTAAE